MPAPLYSLLKASALDQPPVDHSPESPHHQLQTSTEASPIGRPQSLLPITHELCRNFNRLLDALQQAANRATTASNSEALESASQAFDQVHTLLRLAISGFAHIRQIRNAHEAATLRDLLHNAIMSLLARAVAVLERQIGEPAGPGNLESVATEASLAVQARCLLPLIQCCLARYPRPQSPQTRRPAASQSAGPEANNTRDNADSEFSIFVWESLLRDACGASADESDHVLQYVPILFFWVSPRCISHA